jgi:hypothetical protein
MSVLAKAQTSIAPKKADVDGPMRAWQLGQRGCKARKIRGDNVAILQEGHVRMILRANA